MTAQVAPSVTPRNASLAATVPVVALPFLVGMGPVIHLWAANAEIVHAAEVVVSLVVVGGVTGIAVAVLSAVTRDIARSSITVAIILLPLLTFGLQLEPLPNSESILVKLLVVAANLGIASVLIWLTWTRDARRVATFASLSAIAFMALSAPRIVSAISASRDVQRGATTTGATGPDVYFIVVDGYGRSDVLTEVYGANTDPFLDGLRDRGFYVADDSYSNYAMTFLSLAATLNMRYLPDDAPYRWGEMDHLIADASVIREFKRNGYEYVFFETGWFGTDEAPLADVSYDSDGPGVFQRALLRSSLPWRILDPPWRHANELEAFDRLSEVPQNEAATFTFAHFLVPHPPFMFRADGSVRPYPDDTSQPYDRAAYAEQVEFVNHKLEEVVDALLQDSDRAPIIIVQGDHGPMLTLETAAAETVWWERHAILNAILVPEEVRADLYPSISPVNTFRVLLPHLFGTDAEPLLHDESFFNWYEPSDSDAVRPDSKELQDVTQALP